MSCMDHISRQISRHPCGSADAGTYHLHGVTEGPGWEERVITERSVATLMTEVCRSYGRSISVHIRPGCDTVNGALRHELREIEASVWDALFQSGGDEECARSLLLAG